jgi:hypothetical protein
MLRTLYRLDRLSKPLYDLLSDVFRYAIVLAETAGELGEREARFR